MAPFCVSSGGGYQLPPWSRLLTLTVARKRRGEKTMWGFLVGRFGHVRRLVARLALGCLLAGTGALVAGTPALAATSINVNGTGTGRVFSGIGAISGGGG